VEGSDRRRDRGRHHPGGDHVDRDYDHGGASGIGTEDDPGGPGEGKGMIGPQAPVDIKDVDEIDPEPNTARRSEPCAAWVA
jgi:hypothetical protein